MFERNPTFWFLVSGGAVLSMVLVFAPGRFIKRLAIYWGAGTLLCACWLIGIGILHLPLNLVHSRLTAEEVALSFPVAALVFQAPLWVLRVCFGWRWQREPDALANSEVHWSLKDLLAGTAWIALSLSLARLVEHEDGFWSAWIEFSKYAFLFSLFTVGPAMVLTLRGWSWRFGVLLFLLLDATLVGGFYGAGAIHGGSGWSWRVSAFFLIRSLTPFHTYAMGLLLATLVVRSLGYRLVMGHKDRRPLQQPQP
jgi:hypothetical protein